MAKVPLSPATPTKPAENNGFAAEDNAIAWLLAGFNSDRSSWSDDTATEVANTRTMSLFYCPLMALLRGRGKTVQKACRDHPKLSRLNVQRRPFNTLARGDAVTLDMILHVFNVLNAIAQCDDEKVKATTRVKRRNRDVCLVLEENDVVPSHLWVNRVPITLFRDHFNISRKRFAELMFGPDKYDHFFQMIEEGEKIKDVEYDFRVTVFTKECMIFAIETLFDAVGNRLQDREYTPPTTGELFSTSSKAGLGAYNRTKALPMQDGNLTRRMKAEDKTAIEERIKAYIKGSPKKIERRVRENSLH
jgi:hypothetical protein